MSSHTSLSAFVSVRLRWFLIGWFSRVESVAQANGISSKERSHSHCSECDRMKKDQFILNKAPSYEGTVCHTELLQSS